MTDWLTALLHSFAGQAGAWFVGLVLAILGAFSTRIVEKVKFALNRADARAKYYEEMAIDISHFVFIVDRLVNVYYGNRWASDEDKSAIAGEYNEVMNKISRKEICVSVMAPALLEQGRGGCLHSDDGKDNAAFRDLQAAADRLLAATA